MRRACRSQKNAAVNLSTVSDKVVLSYLKTTYDKTEKEPDVTIEGLVKGYGLQRYL